jgi:TonB family protein
MDLLGSRAIYSVLALLGDLDRFMRDTIAPEAPASGTFTELNVRPEKGKPYFIRLHDSVVKRLEQHLDQNPASTGLLLGSIEASDSCTIAVELFEPTTRVEELIRASKSSSRPKVVGYYRSHPRDNFTLDAADRDLFARCFPEEPRLALLVRPPEEDIGTAMFFLGENGQLVTERATVEFPFNLRALGAEESPAVSVAVPVVEPAATKSKPGRGGLLWKIAVAGVVVIASVFGLGELRVFDRPEAQPASKPTVMANPAPAEQQPEITKASKPAPAKPPKATMVSAKPASPLAPPKPMPEPIAPSAQQTLVADSSAPKTPITFRQQPVQTTPRAPVAEAQLRPATPAPPVNTERQSISQPVAPANPVQSPKPVVVSLPYTPPSAIRQLAPIVSDKMRRSMTGEVVVRVKVNVDATGKVIAAEPVVSGSPVPEALADSTISAVKRWQFEPARRGGDKVPGDIVLSFTFRK